MLNKDNNLSINVLHLRSTAGMYGAENVLIEIAKNSKLFNINAFVGTIRSINDCYPELLNIAKKYNIPVVDFVSRDKLDINCIKEVQKFVDKNKIDIIHAHGYKENFYCLMILKQIKKISTNHLWKLNSLKSYIYCFIDSFAIRFFDYVVGVSSDICRQMILLQINNVIKVANGIDCKNYTPRTKNYELLKSLGVDSDKFILGMVSSLTPEKNHKVVFDALKVLNNQNIKLVVVGDGCLKNDLIAYTKKIGVSDSVHFVGNQSNVVEFYSIFDVFILSSFSEGLPIALLEAMSCKKTVVASDVGEISYVVTNGYDGLLFDANSVSSLVNKLQLVINSTELCNYLSNNSRNTVCKNYSSLNMAYNYSVLYRNLLKL